MEDNMNRNHTFEFSFFFSFTAFDGKARLLC